MQRGFKIAIGFSPFHLFPLIALKIEDVDVDASAAVNSLVTAGPSTTILGLRFALVSHDSDVNNILNDDWNGNL